MAPYRALEKEVYLSHALSLVAALGPNITHQRKNQRIRKTSCRLGALVGDLFFCTFPEATTN